MNYPTINPSGVLMKIINLIENTMGDSGCNTEHGLSFYIETHNHKILMDTGQTDLIIENAQKLSVDLAKVDMVFLSHGHYDHCGGVLPFTKINNTAKIYIKKDAFGDNYSTSMTKEPRYIGVDPDIKSLNQLVLVDGNMQIEDDIELFSSIGFNRPAPPGNSHILKKVAGNYVHDDFTHEQCLVLRENGKTYLFSGCAHHGILNVMDRYKELYHDDPDYVFSGFHTLKNSGYSDDDLAFITNTAAELNNYRSKFYTCHCTGVEPYEKMREILDDKIYYVHCGDQINIKSNVES